MMRYTALFLYIYIYYCGPLDHRLVGFYWQVEFIWLNKIDSLVPTLADFLFDDMHTLHALLIFAISIWVYLK
jgi:hypothetical protein